MRWGLLPPFYRTPNGGPLLINARAEGIAEKPAFREAVRERRCLVPADGFYEWQGEKGARTPFVIRPRGGGLMAFAGLWQDWRGPEGWISTCAIVTCPANAVLAPIHERMPVVIAPRGFRALAGRGGARGGAADGAGAGRRAGGRAGGRGDAGDAGAAAGAAGGGASGARLSGGAGPAVMSSGYRGIARWKAAGQWLESGLPLC